jgi:hypothetical protein
MNILSTSPSGGFKPQKGSENQKLANIWFSPPRTVSCILSMDELLFEVFFASLSQKNIKLSIYKDCVKTIFV